MNCEAISSNFIDSKNLDLTVICVPTDNSNVAYGDLMNTLHVNGIQAKEIDGIYKVSASDSCFSVLFKDQSTVKHLTRLGKLSSPKFTFDLVHMSQQVIKLRVHWLPLFYGDSLKSVFCEYGEVIEVKRLKTAHDNVVLLNGIREVTLKVDETEKLKIPHLWSVSFGDNARQTTVML